MASSDTPPSKKAKFGDMKKSVHADARTWVSYNPMHNEINLFVKGTAHSPRQHAHAPPHGQSALDLTETRPLSASAV